MALNYLTFESLFSAIAEAIRFQEQSSNKIVADNFPNRIRNLTPTGAGLDTSDATAMETDIFLGKSAYVNGKKIEGTFTIEDELLTQQNLLSQIYSALQQKIEGGE